MPRTIGIVLLCFASVVIGLIIGVFMKSNPQPQPETKPQSTSTYQTELNALYEVNQTVPDTADGLDGQALRKHLESCFRGNQLIGRLLVQNPADAKVQNLDRQLQQKKQKLLAAMDDRLVAVKKTQEAVKEDGMDKAFRQCAEQLVAFFNKQKREEPPAILITPVRNRTTHQIDTNLFTNRMKIKLMTNAKGKIVVLDRSQLSDVLALRARKRAGVVETSAPRQALKGADYILALELTHRVKRSNDVTVDMMQLNCEMINAENMAMAWAQSFEWTETSNHGTLYR